MKIQLALHVFIEGVLDLVAKEDTPIRNVIFAMRTTTVLRSGCGSLGRAREFHRKGHEVLVNKAMAEGRRCLGTPSRAWTRWN